MLCDILWPQNAENQPIPYTFLGHVDNSIFKQQKN